MKGARRVPLHRTEYPRAGTAASGDDEQPRNNERDAQGEHGRLARTVVLKLKTADFHTLTRTFTPTTRPTSAAELAEIACALRDRVERPADSRYRLVGVGLAGFVDADSFSAQSDLFADTPIS